MKTIKKMNKDAIDARRAPCGLHYGKCFAFADGEIRRLSRELRTALGGFDIYAKRFAGMLEEPLFEKYPDFERFLDYLASNACGGCRKEPCRLFRGCKVRSCSSRRGVDYCFRCDEFPCTHTGFDEHLYRRFVAINHRMREEGVERYYDEIKDLPRY